MKTTIITIGDELLIGQVVDTNSAWMASNLTKAGFEVVSIYSVGDVETDILKTIAQAMDEADILLLTGGIGPTNDDITKRTLCHYFDTRLVFREEVLQNIQQVFSARHLRLNELTREQAMVPEKCTVIQNRVGTAPLLWFEKAGKVLVSLPGVPFEMKNALREEIIPRLQSKFHTEAYLQQVLMVAGITESALAIRLTAFERTLPKGTSLAYLPHYGLIKLRLSTRDQTLKETFFQLVAELKQQVSGLLIAEEDLTPEELLGKKLQAKGLTLSTAESCTGGLIAHKITSIAGASAYFKGSIVSYANEVKTRLLGVEPDVIKQAGVVSREVVCQMAKGCATAIGTDCSIAVSGIAGPSGGSPEKPVGTVWISTRVGEKSIEQVYHTGNARRENIERAANMAILQLIRML